MLAYIQGFQKRQPLFIEQYLAVVAAEATNVGEIC